MKQRIINSQISNFRTYQMYLRQMLTLAENVFEFKNMPELIDMAFVNKTLVGKGAVVFFQDKELGELGKLIALPYSSNMGKLDIYGRPTNIIVTAQNGYRRYLKPEEYVLMYDNNGRYPIYLDICQMAERIALCIRTQDTNIKQQRTPRIIKTSSDQEVSTRRLMEDIDANSDVITTFNDSITDDIDIVLKPAPYVSDKIDDHLKELWADFFRLIGVSNLVMQKKERMIRDEMVASQGGTIASRWSRFEPRRRAIEEINKKFNMNLSVNYYDGEPDSNEKGEEDNATAIPVRVSGDTEYTETIA